MTKMTEAEVDASPAVRGRCPIHLPNGLVCGEYMRHGLPNHLRCTCKGRGQFPCQVMSPDDWNDSLVDIIFEPDDDDTEDSPKRAE